MIISIAAVILLLILSAYFSGSETALTGASQAYMMDQEKNEDNQKAKVVNRLFAQKDRLIITTLIGSNLSNTLGTALATSVLIDMFGSEGVFYATVIMTILVLVYTDMLPKSYSVLNANTVALYVAPIMRFWVWLFSPLAYVLQFIVHNTFKLFGIKGMRDCDNETRISEIRGAICMYGGGEIKEEKAMLESILDLSDVQVYDVMKHRKDVFSLDIDMPIDEMLEKIKNSIYSRIPLYKDRPENIVGVIRSSVFLKSCVENHGNLEKVNVRELLSAPWFIPENTTLRQQLKQFRDRREHFAIVVDEYGSLLGIVTLEDILEEIVGDINDESDKEKIDIGTIEEIGKNAIKVGGQVTIRDLNRKYGWDLADEEAVTVAGYLLDMAQTIPEQGQKFIFEGFEFEVLKRVKNQLVSIKITKTDE